MIDQTDKLIAELVAGRIDQAGEIVKAKQAKGLPIFSPARQQLIHLRIEQTCKNASHAQALHGIFRELMKASFASAGGLGVCITASEFDSLKHPALRRFGKSAKFSKVTGLTELAKACLEKSCDIAIVSQSALDADLNAEIICEIGQLGVEIIDEFSLWEDAPAQGKNRLFVLAKKRENCPDSSENARNWQLSRAIVAVQNEGEISLIELGNFADRADFQKKSACLQEKYKKITILGIFPAQIAIF